MNTSVNYDTTKKQLLAILELIELNHGFNVVPYEQAHELLTDASTLFGNIISHLHLENNDNSVPEMGKMPVISTPCHLESATNISNLLVDIACLNKVNQVVTTHQIFDFDEFIVSIAQATSTYMLQGNTGIDG